MAQSRINQGSGRRRFIGSLAVGAAGIGASIAAPLSLQASPIDSVTESDPEAIFSKLTGKHKMVFDATQPHGVFPFAWPRVFLMTNEMTGSPQKECNAIVVLRHDAIPYAMEDKLWEKYKFGEFFKADDPSTKARATRNPFAKPAAGEYKVPGIDPIALGINELQASSVQKLLLKALPVMPGRCPWICAMMHFAGQRNLSGPTARPQGSEFRCR